MDKLESCFELTTTFCLIQYQTLKSSFAHEYYNTLYDTVSHSSKCTTIQLLSIVKQHTVYLYECNISTARMSMEGQVTQAIKIRIAGVE